MRRFTPWLCLGLVVVALSAMADSAETYAKRVGTLIDPTKLATLGQRGANPRVQKYVAQLAEARLDNVNPSNVVQQAVTLVGLKGDAANLTAEAMLRNLEIADRLGCLDAEGIKDMRAGKAATVRRGPYAGDQLSVDHIIPRAVVPELDNVIANLELMPLRMNEGKNDKVGERQLSLAKRLKTAGLLSKSGLKKVEQSGKKSR